MQIILYFSNFLILSNFPLVVFSFSSIFFIFYLMNFFAKYWMKDFEKYVHICSLRLNIQDPQTPHQCFSTHVHAHTYTRTCAHAQTHAITHHTEFNKKKSQLPQSPLLSRSNLPCKGTGEDRHQDSQLKNWYWEKKYIWNICICIMSNLIICPCMQNRIYVVLHKPSLLSYSCSFFHSP